MIGALLAILLHGIVEGIGAGLAIMALFYLGDTLKERRYERQARAKDAAARRAYDQTRRMGR